MITKTNLIKNKLTEQLPAFVGQDPYINELLMVKMNEFTSLEEFEQDLEKQFFVDTATWGLAFWEKSLNIPVVRDYNKEYMFIEEDNPDIHFYGKWSEEDLNNSEFFKTYNMNSNGLIKSCEADEENWIEYTFWGQGIRIVSSNINQEYCKAKVIIDSISYECLNYNDGTACVEKVIFEKKDLSWGSHTIRITLNKSADDSKNNKFTLDRFEVLNALDNSYSERRKNIKAKLMPVRKVTRQTIIDRAHIYGFDDITIDESNSGYLKIEFNDTSSSNATLRKNLLHDIKVLIPAHLVLQNKFLVSTFADINKEQLTWQEIKDNNYSFNDFLLSGVDDPKGFYTQLYKYLELSVFNYKSFNMDLAIIDSLIQEYYYNNIHNGNRIPYNNIIYNIDYNDLKTSQSIADYFSELERKLLTNAQRVKLYSLSSRNVTNYQNNPLLTTAVQNYADAIENLKKAVNNHVYLKSKNVNITTNNIKDIIEPTKYFKGIIDYGTDDTFIKKETEVVPSKIAYNGQIYIKSCMKQYDLDELYTTLKDYPNGITLTNVYTDKDFVLDKQTALIPQNIVKGITMFNVEGSMEIQKNDFYVGDYVDIEEATTSDGRKYFKIKSI